MNKEVEEQEGKEIISKEMIDKMNEEYENE